MKNFKGFFRAFFCLFLLSSPAFSANTVKNSDKNKIINPQEKIELSANKKKDEIYKHSLTASIGKLSGKADEIVYEGGKKLSHLEWDIKNLKMLSLGFNSQINDLFEARINFSNALNGGNGRMVDSDWDGDGYDGNINRENWTDRSFSDVKIQKAQQFNIVGSFNIHKDELRFNVGYKYDRFKWRDYGGDYIYSKYDFRDDIGNFGGERGISYEQTFKTPYVGVEYKKELFDKKISANIFANYSNLVLAQAEDVHHARNLKFTDNFTNGEYINWGANILGKVKENIYLGFGYEFVYYPENKGYTIIKDLTTNETERTEDDSAGIRNKYSKISINLKYNFTTTSNFLN